MNRAALRAQLERHEGKRLRVYTDALGIETIGVGRNIRDKGLSEAEVSYLLDNDIDECLDDMQSFPWFAELDAVRQLAVIDFRFNLGPIKFRGFRRFLAGMAAKDYALACTSMRESRWFTQVQPDRSGRLLQQIRDGGTA